MPRNVRNFWVTLGVDGRKSEIAAGPVRGDGGIELLIEIRENGTISNKRLRIDGSCVDGNISLRVRGVDGIDTIFDHAVTTVR